MCRIAHYELTGEAHPGGDDQTQQSLVDGAFEESSEESVSGEDEGCEEEHADGYPGVAHAVAEPGDEVGHLQPEYALLPHVAGTVLKPKDFVYVLSI